MKLLGQEDFKDTTLYKVQYELTTNFRIYSRIYYTNNANFTSELEEILKSTKYGLHLKVVKIEIIDIYNDLYFVVKGELFNSIVNKEKKEDNPVEKKEDNQ